MMRKAETTPATPISHQSCRGASLVKDVIAFARVVRPMTCSEIITGRPTSNVAIT